MASLGGGATQCSACGEKVYKLELMTIDKLTLHKSCFKCTHCKCQLTLSNYAAVNNKVYCKPHYKEIFHSNGGTYSAFGGDNFQHQETRARKPSTGELEQPTTTTTTQEENQPKASLKQKLQDYEKVAGSQQSALPPKHPDASATDDAASATESETEGEADDVGAETSSVGDNKESSDAEIRRLEEQNKALEARVKELEAQLAEQKEKSRSAMDMCSKLTENIQSIKNSLA